MSDRKYDDDSEKGYVNEAKGEEAFTDTLPIVHDGFLKKVTLKFSATAPVAYCALSFGTLCSMSTVSGLKYVASSAYSLRTAQPSRFPN